MNKNLKGTVSKIRIINDDCSLIRFTLECDQVFYNCLVHQNDLILKILMLPAVQTDVSVFGHFNKRKQLIIDKFSCQNNLISDFGGYKQKRA